GVDGDLVLAPASVVIVQAGINQYVACRENAVAVNGDLSVGVELLGMINVVRIRGVAQSQIAVHFEQTVAHDGHGSAGIAKIGRVAAKSSPVRFGVFLISKEGGIDINRALADGHSGRKVFSIICHQQRAISSEIHLVSEETYCAARK